MTALLVVAAFILTAWGIASIPRAWAVLRGAEVMGAEHASEADKLAALGAGYRQAVTAKVLPFKDPR